MTLDPRRRQEPLDLAELARLLPAPGDPVLPPDRRLRLEEHLMSEIQQQHTRTHADTRPEGRRPRRRLAFIAGSAALVLLGGGAIAATTLLGDEPASVGNSVRCYSAAKLTDTPHTTTAMAGPGTGAPATDISATVDAAIRACAGLWEAGLIEAGKLPAPTARPGEPLVIPSAAPGQGRVPLLTACRLDSGEAAVLPGDDRTCQNLGLPRLADQRG